MLYAGINAQNHMAEHDVAIAKRSGVCDVRRGSLKEPTLVSEQYLPTFERGFAFGGGAILERLQEAY